MACTVEDEEVPEAKPSKEAEEDGKVGTNALDTAVAQGMQPYAEGFRAAQVLQQQSSQQLQQQQPFSNRKPRTTVGPARKRESDITTS